MFLARRIGLRTLAPALAIGLAFLPGRTGSIAGDDGSVSIRPRTTLASYQQIRVPRLSLEGGVGWINTDRPIHLDKLRGKIVVLDFWTYCCINCHHVLPDLAKLEEKYKNQLVVIGVHTAKFPAERETENIRKKVREYNIKHPVVNDANQVLWRRFGIQGWPTLVAIDPTGMPVYAESGEGQFAALDQVIGELVKQHKALGDLDETPIQFFPEREKSHAEGLLFPGKVLADAIGNRLFISDTGNNRVVITNLAGEFQASIGGGEEGLADGPFEQARLNRPQGMCLVGETLFIADTENHAIRAADLMAKRISTVVGNGTQAAYGARGGKGTETSLNSPWDLVLLPGTRILAIAMAGPHQIWRYDLDTGAARSWAGSGRENIVDGPLAAADFAQPSGLATDGTRLFVADSEVSGVREIDLSKPDDQRAVETVVGVDLFGFGDVDGRGSRVRLQHCLGVAFGKGRLFIADSYNNKIKSCDPATRAVESLVGSRSPGVTDSPPLFNEPGGLSVAGDDLYVADTNNHRIRVVSLDTKKVRTLNLAGVTAPRIRPIPTFPGASIVDVERVEIAPGREFTLSITPRLEKGYDLNSQAPMTFLVETPGKPGSLSSESPAQGGRIDPPSIPFTVKVPLAKDAQPGETLNVKVSLRAMVCLPNTLCTVKNFAWNIPVQFVASAPKQVSIGGK